MFSAGRLSETRGSNSCHRVYAKDELREVEARIADMTKRRDAIESLRDACTALLRLGYTRRQIHQMASELACTDDDKCPSAPGSY